MVFNPIWWCMRSKLVVCNQVVGAITTIWRHLLLLPPSASLPSLPSPNWGQGSRCPGTRRPHATVAPPGNHMASWSPNCQALRRSGYPCDPHKYQAANRWEPYSQVCTCSTGDLGQRKPTPMPGRRTNRAAGAEYKRPCPANGRPPAGDRAALPMCHSGSSRELVGSVP